MAVKLTTLASKPKLVRIELDDEQIREAYGDAIEFYVYDRQPLEVFAKLATAKAENIGDMIKQVRDLILDDKGKPVMSDTLMLPSDVLLKAVNRVVETLGK